MKRQCRNATNPEETQEKAEENRRLRAYSAVEFVAYFGAGWALREVVLSCLRAEEGGVT